MPKKGYKQTEEHRAKCAKLRLGNKHRLGISHTEETKKKLSNFMKNNPNKGQFKKGQISHNKGKALSIEIRQKMRKAALGKMSAFKGRKHTKESKLKMSMDRLDIPRVDIRGKKNGMYGRRGKFHPAFKGGMNEVKYPRIFNMSLKNDIRRRDNFTCQCCGMTQEEHIAKYNMRLTVHHIDYDKQHCEYDNLITLCLQDNINANQDRDYWFAYYTYILNITIASSKSNELIGKK